MSKYTVPGPVDMQVVAPFYVAMVSKVQIGVVLHRGRVGMSSTNGRCNSAERGPSAARRARKLWLLSAGAGWGGDGVSVPCWECCAILEYEDIFVDRLIPGERGGTYRRSNIAPHCSRCSCRQGQRRTTAIRFGFPPYFDAALDPLG